MDLEKTSIERLKIASELSLLHYQKPLLLTYSGGKDSDVCLELAKRSGIPFEVINSHTTADAPETVYHIRKKFHELELHGIHCEIVYPTYKGKRTSMWKLIPEKLIPPTRMVRYCCEVLKETTGANRAIVTGVRRAESTKRTDRGVYETITPKKKDKIILNNDNDDRRQLTEHCQMQGKIANNIIVDWSDRDVWDYLKDCKTQVNPLYQCGFNRVGCIGCPLAGIKRWAEFNRYPKYQQMYIHAFDRMLEVRKAKGYEDQWKSGEDVFMWWMEDKNLDGQIDFNELLLNVI